MPVQFGSPGVFTFGVSNVSESSAVTSSSGATTATFSFGSTFNTSTGFSFGASSSSSFGPAYSAPTVFGSAASATTSSLPSSSTQRTAKRQRIGKRSPFAASAGNNDQMNSEDSMAEDPVQPSTPAAPVFGQSPVSPSPQGFVFGTTVQPPAGPLQFGGQQNQAAPQNPFQFRASSSPDFNARGGSFSLGSSGPEKSGRKVVKVNRNRTQKR